MKTFSPIKIINLVNISPTIVLWIALELDHDSNAWEISMGSGNGLAHAI